MFHNCSFREFLKRISNNGNKQKLQGWSCCVSVKFFAIGFRSAALIFLQKRKINLLSILLHCRMLWISWQHLTTELVCSLQRYFCALSFCMCQQLTLLHLGLPAFFFDHPVNYLDFCLLLFVPYIFGEIFNAQIYKIEELSNEVIDAVPIWLNHLSIHTTQGRAIKQRATAAFCKYYSQVLFAALWILWPTYRGV